jgi:hypothetical protein
MAKFFWEDKDGNSSSTRIYGGVTILAGLMFVEQILYWGRNDISTVLSGAAILFTAVGGSAMAYIFYQKNKNEKTPVVDQPVDESNLNLQEFYLLHKDIIDRYNELVAAENQG